MSCLISSQYHSFKKKIFNKIFTFTHWFFFNIIHQFIVSSNAFFFDFLKKLPHNFQGKIQIIGLPIFLASLLARARGRCIIRIGRCGSGNSRSISSVRCGGFGSSVRTVFTQTATTALDVTTATGRCTGSVILRQILRYNVQKVGCIPLATRYL